MKAAVFFLGAALAVPCGAQEGGGESLSVADMALGMKTSEDFLKQHESGLKAAGILDPRTGVSGESAQMEAMAKAAAAGKDIPAAAAGETKLGFGGVGAAAISQLKTTPGARAKPVSDVDGIQLSKDKGGHIRSADDIMAERIGVIASKKVSTPAAERAFKDVLWAAYRVDLAKAGDPEVRGLFLFLKEQLTEEKMGDDLWPVGWDASMPDNILATYQKVIKVGPSFAKMARMGQTTTMFHEMMHGYDDGWDGSPIESNRMSGAYAYSPSDRRPAYRNAAEMLSYTDMPKWALAY